MRVTGVHVCTYLTPLMLTLLYMPCMSLPVPLLYR